MQAWFAKEGACRAWVKMPYNKANHVSHIDPNAWDETRQLKAGFAMGLRLTDVEAARQSYSDFNGLISVFANFVAASRALASRM